MTVLEFDSVTKVYSVRGAGQMKALDDVSFTLRSGQTIGLVGQSPAYMGTRVVNLKLENVPGRTCTSQHCRTPWSGHPEQWFFK